MNDRHQKDATPFSSNAERLSVREWFGLLLVLIVLGVLAGPIWRRIEMFEPSPNYRIPYELSEDYWLFERFCRGAGESEKSFIIGDSFVWGQYVDKSETLSSFLNQQSGSERFVNAGLDGSHPLALEGLIKHYCTGLRNRNVVVHLNLLWVSSPEADLRLERGFSFNHPRLVPQFVPTIPSYEAPISEKMGIALARLVPVPDWSRHIQSAYFSNFDLPRWTLDNPYRNPLRQITGRLPEPTNNPHPNAEAWFVDGATLQAPPWVDVEKSLQWRAFQRLVGTLRARGNSVFILVGPLNEHMLEPSSVARYRGILVQVESWLNDHNLPYYIPPVLPSDLYADMSHPLGEGYEILAGALWGELELTSGSARLRERGQALLFTQ